MSKTVILVDHPVGKRDDRASRHIAARGYRVQWCCPGKGDPLPEPGPEHVAALVYGGVESVNDEVPHVRAELAWIERWLSLGRPYLGFCLGGQMLARVLGGSVAPHPQGHFEIGYVPVEPTPAANGFAAGISHVYHWHKEGFEVPACAELLLRGPVFPNQAFRYGGNAYGLQFHPEVSVAVLTRWMAEAGHMLANPNAHPRERQLADAARFDPPLAAWLGRFLDGWLGQAAQTADA